VLVTNVDLTAENIYALYRGHAVIETIIERIQQAAYDRFARLQIAA
jgi:hypothetical protein